MPNPTVTTVFASPPPNANPLNLIQLFQLANLLVSSTIGTDQFLNVVIQSDEPGVDNRDTIWVVTNTTGNPLAIKIWHPGSSKWRRIYNGMMGEVRGFTGDPGFNETGNFGPTGTGNIGGEYDGWHVCNGQDGTPDLSNQFIVGADMAATYHGYTGGQWVTKTDATTAVSTGGQFNQLLTAENIPLPVLSTVDLKMDRYRIGSGGETVDAGGLLWGQPNTLKQIIVPEYPPANYPGNAAPKGVSTTPPFYSLAWITFIGYA